MGRTEPQVAQDSIVAKASADVAFELVEDIVRWPQFFSHVVHIERTPVGRHDDLVDIWALRGEDMVHHWKARRTVDRSTMTITTTRESAEPPFIDFGAAWTFEALATDEVRITLRHDYTLRPDTRATPADVAKEMEKHAARQLEELKSAAERIDELRHLVVDFEDPLFVCGEVEDAYEVLYRCDLWPERLSHVARLELTESTPNIQFFDMDTTTSDGRPHTTRSVRVCLPYGLIVYKQIKTPPLLEVHTGHWRFTPTSEGLIVGARHTVTINPARLSLLGPDTTIQDARRYLRRVLSANSMTNLRLAKTFAEERAGF